MSSYPIKKLRRPSLNEFPKEIPDLYVIASEEEDMLQGSSSTLLTYFKSQSSCEYILFD